MCCIASLEMTEPQSYLDVHNLFFVCTVKDQSRFIVPGSKVALSHLILRGSCTP